MTFLLVSTLAIWFVGASIVGLAISRIGKK